MPTFEEWFASTDKVDWRLFGKKDLYEAYSAGRADEKFAANNRAGDSANEAEKDARRKKAVDKILTEWVDQFTRWKAGKPELDAILKEAQG